MYWHLNIARIEEREQILTVVSEGIAGAGLKEKNVT